MEDDAGLARLVLQKSDAVQVVATECLGMSQELAEELGLANLQLGFAVGEMREDVVRLSPCRFLIARHEAAAVHTEPCCRFWMKE